MPAACSAVLFILDNTLQVIELTERSENGGPVFGMVSYMKRRHLDYIST